MSERFVSFHYVLKNEQGEELDSSRDGEPMSFVEGTGQIIPGLETGLAQLKPGDKKRIVVPAEDAYGERDERLVMEVPLTELPQAEKIKIGTQFDVELTNDSSHVFRVTELDDSTATLDGNHALAGMDLYFDVEVKEARLATDDEKKAAIAEATCGHDHGDGGQCH